MRSPPDCAILNYCLILPQIMMVARRMSRKGSSKDSVTDGVIFGRFDALGGGELDNSSIHRLRFDPAAGYAFAATLHGGYRSSLGAAQSGPWQQVLAPLRRQFTSDRDRSSASGPLRGRGRLDPARIVA